MTDRDDVSKSGRSALDIRHLLMDGRSAGSTTGQSVRTKVVFEVTHQLGCLGRLHWVSGIGLLRANRVTNQVQMRYIVI